MNNCICCHKPIGTGTLYIVLEGNFNLDHDNFTVISDDAEFLCSDCYNEVQVCIEEKENFIQIGNLKIS